MIFLIKSESKRERNEKFSRMNEERSLKEYEICLDQASRLESNIWRTAGLLGIGSIIGLISLADKENVSFGTILVSAIFAINVSLIWHRFARRWGSIQAAYFKRMEEIEEILGFNLSKLINHLNKASMGHKIYLRKNGNWLEKLKAKVFYNLAFLPKEKFLLLYSNESDEDKRSIEGYEYRGNQPAILLLVTTNIILWAAFAFSEAWNKAGKLNVPNDWVIPFNFFLFCMTLL